MLRKIWRFSIDQLFTTYTIEEQNTLTRFDPRWKKKMRHDNKQIMFQPLHCGILSSLSYMKLAPLLFYFIRCTFFLYILCFESVHPPHSGCIKKAKALVCNELKSVNRVFSFLLNPFISIARSGSNTRTPSILFVRMLLFVSVAG